MHDDPALKHLGLALLSLRQLQGLNQTELAAKAGITRAMLSSYENERRVPTLGVLIRVLEAMKFDLCTLAKEQTRLRGTDPEKMKQERPETGQTGDGS